MKSIAAGLLLFFTLAFKFSHLQAQGIPIIGIVKDSASGSPLEFATSGLVLPSGKVVAIAFCDSAGHFELKAPGPGNYSLRLGLEGYKEIQTNSFSILPAQSQYDAGSFLLRNQSKTLGEVSIEGKKSLLRMEAGKLIYNAESSAANMSGNVADILGRIPGVALGNGGEIIVKGKKGVRILVDGRVNAFAQSDPKGFLNSLSASEIASIEVITSPDVRYDAAGAGAIINIILKKGTRRGNQGQIIANLGGPQVDPIVNKFNFNGSGSINTEKLFTYFSASLQHTSFAPSWRENRLFKPSDSIINIKTINEGLDNDKVANLRSGAEYQVNKQHTFGAFAGFIDKQSGGPWVPSVEFLRNGIPDGRSALGENLYSTHTQTTSAAVYHKFESDSGKFKLNTDILWTGIRTKTNDKILSRTSENPQAAPITSLDVLLKPENALDNLVIMVNASQKGKSGLVLDWGIKNESNFNRNLFRLLQNSDKGYLEDSTAKNQFEYRENILAAYISNEISMNKIVLKSGLRAEHTLVGSNQTSVKQNYVSLFPNAGITYNPSEETSLSFLYSRRIERPGFGQLNNAATFYDQYTINRGNPNLRPQFVDNLSLEYFGKIADQDVFASLSATRNHNAKEEVSYVGDGKVQLQPANWGSIDVLGLDLGGNFQLAEGLKISISGGVYYNQFRVTYPGIMSRNPGFVFSGGLNLDYDFGRNYSFQILNNYNSGWIFFNGSSLYSGNTNLTLKKSILDNKLMFFVNANDIFNTNRWAGNWKALGIESSGTWKPETRIFYVGINWKFGSGKQGKQPKLPEKNQRLDTGGGRQ